MIQRLALCAAFLAIVPVAQAQFSTAGLSIRPHLIAAGWTVEDVDIDSATGGGLGLGVSWGFSELVAAYVELSGASVQGDGDMYGLGHFDVGARFTFVPTRDRIKLFANAALSGRSAPEADTGSQVLELVGAGLTVGAGLEYRTSRPFGFQFDVQATMGEYTDVNAAGFVRPITVNSTSVRANFGVVWYPGRN